MPCVAPSRHFDHRRPKPRRQSSRLASRVRWGILSNPRQRECFVGDPQSGSRSDADSAVPNGMNRLRRFDRREGHDLERLLWPGTGSGDSTGLQRNCTVDGRHVATVQSIRSASSIVVKQGRSSVLHRPNDRATSAMPVPPTSASPTWRREEKRLHRRCDRVAVPASGCPRLSGCVQALGAGLVLMEVVASPFILWRRKSEPECAP